MQVIALDYLIGETWKVIEVANFVPNIACCLFPLGWDIYIGPRQGVADAPMHFVPCSVDFATGVASLYSRLYLSSRVGPVDEALSVLDTEHIPSSAFDMMHRSWSLPVQGLSNHMYRNDSNL